MKIPVLVTEKTIALAEIIKPLAASWQGLLIVFGDTVFEYYSKALTEACKFEVRVFISEGDSENLSFSCPDKNEPELMAAVQLAYEFCGKSAILEGQCSEIC